MLEGDGRVFVKRLFIYLFIKEGINSPFEWVEYTYAF